MVGVLGDKRLCLQKKVEELKVKEKADSYLKKRN